LGRTVPLTAKITRLVPANVGENWNNGGVSGDGGDDVSEDYFAYQGRDFEWREAGWHRLLPSEGQRLRALVYQATEEQLDGSLDYLVLSFPREWSDRNGGLEGGLTWEPEMPHMHNRDVEEAVRRREVCLEVLTAAGIPIPLTVRDLADTMTRIGLFTVTDRGTPSERWRTERFLPHPDEILALPREWIEENEQERWMLAFRDAIFGFWEIQERRRFRKVDQWRTSINRLAKSAKVDPESMRQALAVIVSRKRRRRTEWGLKVSTVGKDGPFDADLERIALSKTIYLEALPSPDLQAAFDDVDRRFGEAAKRRTKED
jgi:hypothetical protein